MSVQPARIAHPLKYSWATHRIIIIVVHGSHMLTVHPDCTFAAVQDEVETNCKDSIMNISKMSTFQRVSLSRII